jgi:hypothetical protein
VAKHDKRHVELAASTGGGILVRKSSLEQKHSKWALPAQLMAALPIWLMATGLTKLCLDQISSLLWMVILFHLMMPLYTVA